METAYKRYREIKKFKSFLKGKGELSRKEEDVGIDGVCIGRPDNITSTKVIERKKIGDWKHALGQVLAYAFALEDKKPVLELIKVNKEDHEELEPIIRKVCSKYNVDVRFIIHSGESKDWRFHLSKDDLIDIISDKCKVLDLPIPKKEISSRKISELTILASCVSIKDLKKDPLVTVAKKVGVYKSSLKKNELLSLVLEHIDDKIDETYIHLFHERTLNDEPEYIPKGTKSRPKKEKKEEITIDLDFDTEIDIEDMTVQELKEYINALGIDIPSRMTKPYLQEIVLNPHNADKIITKFKNRKK